jgi:hypothetical protein
VTPLSKWDNEERNDDHFSEDTGDGPASYSLKRNVKSRKLRNAMMAVTAFKDAGRRADKGKPIIEDAPEDSDLGTSQSEGEFMSPHEEPASSTRA